MEEWQALFTILNGQMVKKARPITLSFYELTIGSFLGLILSYFSWKKGIFKFMFEMMHQEFDFKSDIILINGIISTSCVIYFFGANNKKD